MQKTILRIMQLLNQEFKFFEISDEKIASWTEFLKDIPSEQLYGATVACISEGSTMVPTWGIIRKKALLFNNQGLNVSASKAWGHILLKIKNKDFKLTELESKALACTCDLYTLRNKDINQLGYDRTFFVKHYEELRNIEIQKITTPEPVKNLLENNNTKKLEN